MNDVTDPRAWVAKAEDDYALALASMRRRKPILYGACFHAQQCAEKYLKAVLVARKQRFPKVHDLNELQNLCAKAGILVEMDKDKLQRLTTWAVHVRYPGLPIDTADAKEALATAKVIRKFIRQQLGYK